MGAFFGLESLGKPTDYSFCRITLILCLPATLYTIQLGLNLIWMPLFFRLNRPIAAAFDILALGGTVSYLTYIWGQVDETSGWLLAPYLGWLGFASYLCVSQRRTCTLSKSLTYLLRLASDTSIIGILLPHPSGIRAFCETGAKHRSKIDLLFPLAFYSGSQSPIIICIYILYWAKARYHIVCNFTSLYSIGHVRTC